MNVTTLARLCSGALALMRGHGSRVCAHAKARSDSPGPAARVHTPRTLCSPSRSNRAACPTCARSTGRQLGPMISVRGAKAKLYWLARLARWAGRGAAPAGPGIREPDGAEALPMVRYERGEDAAP